MRPLPTIFLLLLSSTLWAAEKPVAMFTENKGQWPENVLYRTRFPGGTLFVEKNAFTFLLVKGGPMAHHGHDHDAPEEPLHAHAYRVTFEGAQLARGEGFMVQPHYENYFLGNDPAKWGSRCGVFGEVVLHDLYPGIDLRIDGRKGLKYEFILDPGVDPAMIQMRFEGQDAIQLADGKLVVSTTAGSVTEEAPVSYRQQPIPLPAFDPLFSREEVPSAYTLAANTARFAIQRSNDATLIIDPDLTFGSFSGSTADNFGCTATYDNDGHLYGGGIVFGGGYPTTLGVLDASFNGGTIDIGISKWTPDGTSLAWSTYIGGAFGNESPHSLVVNDNDELYVLASTGSSDFPTTPGCFDNTFNGGPSLFFNIGYGYDHDFGVDIAVTHLSADATSLLGSTYVGGTGSDGINHSLSLAWNYGDSFRGEIALDPQQDPVISTTTSSNDIPTTAGAPQSSFGGGGQDAYYFRLDPSCSSLDWATFHGGSNDDSGYGVQMASNGEMFFSGGTNSSNMPMSGSPWDNSSNGGVDGYIARFNADGSVRLSTTYLGTNGYDQSYFVQLDLSDEVYVVGQTHGAYPVTPGKYTNPGSSQFIHKFSQDLTTSIWSTVIGNGNGDEDISPSAFLVSDCGQIYFSGWGGVTNANAQAFNSTTLGLPVTPDAFSSSTNGNDFYLMVLQPEAVGLHYATFFGGLSSEHVDGGTSRFDKNGNVYQAVCAGCGGQSDFPTTPDAWSTTNNSFNCNLGVFKFNLTQPVAQIAIDGPTFVCLPNGADFLNLSIGGSDYLWDFGDNTSSTEFQPSHTWTEAGEYTVTMILSDSSACLPNDTATIIINVFEPDNASIDPVGPVCDGGTVQLQAHGGTSYEWFPTTGLSDPFVADPIATLDSAITYSVIASSDCGVDTASIDLVIGTPTGEAGPDTVTCTGTPVPITASGGATYLWSPAASLDDPTAQSPNASPIDTTVYVVQITTAEGCVLEDSLVVNVQFDLPAPLLADVAVCLGGSVQLHAEGGDAYEWLAAPGIISLFTPDPLVSPTFDMYYLVLVSNTCGSVLDSAFVDVQQVIAGAWPDTIVCPGEPVTIFAAGGISYAWLPAGSLSHPDSSITVAAPATPTTYTVTASNALGCEGMATVVVEHFPEPNVNAGQDTGIDYGESTQLVGFGTGSMVWSPAISLTCDSCVAPIASPEQTTTYTLELTDANGCRAYDVVTVFVNGTLYVPNTFTPDGDGINDSFRALATEIAEFRMLVFNRWGEEIYEADLQDRAWDGTYQGVQSPIGTYVWRIDLKELNGKKRTVFGHVNLVR